MEKQLKTSDRLLSLDVMRGATILAMILVNNPGSWGHMYWPLAHAPWHGWTPTDLIFPFFVYMVGVSMAYSFRKFEGNDHSRNDALLRVLKRTAILILLGLVLATSGQWLGIALGRTTSISLSETRFPGVLQRIALAYLGASIIVLYCGPKLRLAFAAILLFGYAALLWFTPTNVPFADRVTPGGNIVRVVDLAVLGPNHMYTQAKSELTDPEGLLSTLPSIVTALIGYAVGRYLQRDGDLRNKILPLFVVGLSMAALGQLWHWLDPALGGMPINKKLWTSSFVLLTGGLGTATLAVCLLVFDVLGAQSTPLRRVATAFQVVGVNAIFVFVASGVFARLLSMIKLGESNVKDQFYQTVFAGPLGDGNLASLGFALTNVAFWWFVLWIMWKRDLSIRV